MAAFAPRSTAALTAGRELADTAEQALVDAGYYRPRVERAERVDADHAEILFTVEIVGGARGARLAYLTPAGLGRVVTGWPLEPPPLA